MTVRKRGDKYEVSFYYRHPITGARMRFRQLSPYSSKALAKRWEQDQITLVNSRAFWEHKADREALDVAPTMEAFAQTWLDRHAKTHCKPSTVRTYSQIIDGHITPTFGEMKITEIVRSDIDQFVADLADPEGKDLSRKTIANVTGVLSKILERAHAWDLIGQIPKIEIPKVGDPEWHFLTEDEALALVESSEEWITPIFKVALQTGMRFGELAGLQWRDIDPRQNQITVNRGYVRGAYTTPKSHHIRTVPIAPDLARELMELRHSLPKKQQRGQSPVFTVRHEGEELITYPNTKHSMWRAYEQAEIPSYKNGWHILRHTFATLLAGKGVPMRVLQKLLGHSTIAMTERYAHFAPGASDAARSHLMTF